MRALYLASAADRVITSPLASFELAGIGATTRYLGAALAKLGLKVEPFAQGRFKTAVESLASGHMSEPQREQLGALLDAFDVELRRALAQRPALDEEVVERLFESASAEEAKERQLVDAVAYEDELPPLLDADPKRPSVSASAYLESRRAPLLRPLRRPKHLAVIEIHGAITRGGRGASQLRLVRELRAARADRRALGVILDIDSPGGSALASDLIHREVLRLAEEKPVVALFGAVAASGGYYVAAPAHAIVAAPTSITGSIGVIAARLDASALLDRLGVHSESLLRAPHADLLDPSRESTDAERALMDRELAVAYQGFLKRVAQGRGLSEQRVHELAQGRVWSGADAHERGLVDRLGGLAEVRAVIAERLSMPLGRVERLALRRVRVGRRHPAPAPPLEALLRELSPEAADLLRLTTGSERVLYYDPQLPRML
ncbi:MAG: signal peptide peptidase SppA [Deltaproteobacteria bacterium]|nr:signal peptide peptidase SppA [Deltaproteobacteria bacterium]